MDASTTISLEPVCSAVADNSTVPGCDSPVGLMLTLATLVPSRAMISACLQAFNNVSVGRIVRVLKVWGIMAR